MAIYKCVKCYTESGITGEPCVLDTGTIPVPTPPDACPFSIKGGPEWELIE